MMSPLQRIFAPDSMGEEARGPVKGRSQRARLSMTMRQAWFVVPFSVFLLMGIAGAALYISSPPTTLRFAVGPPASEDARLVQALAQQFVRDRAAMRLTPVIEEGAAAAQALDAGRAELAIVRRDVAFPQTGQAIAELRESFVAIIVPAAGSLAAGSAKTQRKQSTKAKKPKPIAKIEDLEGRRIGVVGSGSANTDVLDIVLKQYQIDPGKVSVVRLEPRDIAGSLRSNPVDVIFAVGPVAGPMIADAIAASTNGKTEPALLKINASEAIAERHPVYEATEIKAGVLGGQSPLPEEAVETISLKHYIVGRKALPENSVAEFTRLLFAARQTLGGEFPVLAKIEKPDTDRDAAVPAHPGAAAFLDNDQKTFFDKYSDYLYFGLMLMSGLGSGAAWLTSYARADDRIRRLKVLERLLDIVKAARTAETLDQLTNLREEADGVLGRTIRQAEANKLDESALMAFSLALDQAQLAISDRRSTLTAAAIASPGEAPAAESPPPAPPPTRAGIKQIRKTAKIVPEPS
ncbi:MAG: TAXI family TRAP transporter solute-binding subunit [Rhodoplanes sp.]